MTRAVQGVGILILVAAACTPAPTLPLAPSATAAAAFAISTPTATTAAGPAPTESSTLVPTPTLPCETDTASVILSASASRVKVGDTVKITATLNNEGCVVLGLPQYRLYIRSDNPEAILAPPVPEPVVHSLAVAPGQSDTAEFEFRAMAAGQVTLTASASFEVHLGYPGPAYWGYTASRELRILAVAP